MPEDGSRVRRRFEISGLVQGVGFRPFLYVLASELGLSGVVAYTPAGVLVEVEGNVGDVAAFARRLVDDAPPMAEIVAVVESPATPCGGTGFTIAATIGGTVGASSAVVSRLAPGLGGWSRSLCSCSRC